MSPWSLQKRRRTLQLFVRDSSYLKHSPIIKLNYIPQINLKAILFTRLLHFRKKETSFHFHKQPYFFVEHLFLKKQTHQNAKKTLHFFFHHPRKWVSPFLSLRWLGNPLGISAPSKERRACSKARMSRKTDSAKTSPPGQTAKQGGFTVVECFGCVHFDKGNAVKMTKIRIYVIYVFKIHMYLQN